MATIKIRAKPPEEIPIVSEYITLAAFLKLANAVESGGAAKTVIQAGEVFVNAELCLLRGKKLRPGDVVRFQGKRYRVING
ncbi:MAG: RNA-binding S4 domain-containing protein [Oscillospiraceae bacterium]|nr:RNA-binding S4 domain-containing protein [Oscillospiraceae bacterium]